MTRVGIVFRSGYLLQYHLATRSPIDDFGIFVHHCAMLVSSYSSSGGYLWPMYVFCLFTCPIRAFCILQSQYVCPIRPSILDLTTEFVTCCVILLVCMGPSDVSCTQSFQMPIFLFPLQMSVLEYRVILINPCSQSNSH